MIGSASFARIHATSRQQYVVLGLITLVAAALRLYKLGEWSFWIDEIFTVNRALIHYADLGTAIRNLPPYQNSVPLSVLSTAGVLHALGVSEWSARLTSLLFGIVSLPALYFPIRSMLGTRIALISVLLLAVSPWHLFWSQNARFYTALLLFYSLSLFVIFHGLERDRTRYIVFGLLLLFLAMSERMFALFLVPTLVAYLFLLMILPFGKPPGFRMRNIATILAPIIAGGTIEIIGLVTSGSSPFFGDMDWFFLYRNNTPLRLLSLIGFSVGIPLICMASVGAAYLLSQRSRTGLMLVVAVVSPLLLVLAASPFMFTQERYLFQTLPFWAILAAVAVNEIYAQVKKYRLLLAGGVLALLLAHSSGDTQLYYRVNHGNRNDWKGAFTLIKEQSRTDDAFVAYWPEFGPFYLGREVTPWTDTRPRTVAESGLRFWFVLDSETIWGNLEMKYWVEQNANLVDVRYLRMPQDSYLKTYLYDPQDKIRVSSGGLP